MGKETYETSGEGLAHHEILWARTCEVTWNLRFGCCKDTDDDMDGNRPITYVTLNNDINALGSKAGTITLAFAALAPGL